MLTILKCLTKFFFFLYLTIRTYTCDPAIKYVKKQQQNN